MPRHLRLFPAPLAVALALSPCAARAASSGDVLFNGFILGTCTVVVLTPGTLTLNGAGDQLSSKNPGGLPATADVITTSIGYQMSVDASSAFTLAPADGDTGATYSAEYSASGATVLTGVLNGVLSLLGIGTTLLNVDATIDRAGGAFPAGDYQLPVTVQCAVL